MEAVRKESKGRILKEDFDFNPKNRKFWDSHKSGLDRYESELILWEKPNFCIVWIVIAITEKPTRVGGAAASDPTQVTTEEDLRILKEKLDALKQKPKAKFNLPMTTN